MYVSIKTEYSTEFQQISKYSAFSSDVLVKFWKLEEIVIN